MNRRRHRAHGHALQTRLGSTEIHLLLWPAERASIGHNHARVLVLAAAATIEIRRPGRPTRGVWIRLGEGALDSDAAATNRPGSLRVVDIGRVQVRIRKGRQGEGCVP